MLEKIFGRMVTLESQKACAPKFTKSISKLVKFLGLRIDEEQIEKHERSINQLLGNEETNSLGSKMILYSSEPR